MSVQRIAARYAKSLIDLAIEQNKLERIKEDVDSFLGLTQNRDFYLLVKSPIVNAEKKRQIFRTLFEGKYDKLTSSFLDILALKGRETYLIEIAKEFLHQYKDFKHISTVVLTTVSPLGEDTLDALRKKLLASSATDEQVELITKVNPDLVGGFILEVEGKIYDASIASKLDELKKEFKKRNLHISLISKS